MVEKIEYKVLSLADVNENLLDNFNRYQKVTKCWTKENDIWSLIDCEYIVDCGTDKKIILIKEFYNIINKNNGYIIGAYSDDKLVGFSILLNKKFGVNEQYIQLKYLHVSLEYRHKGIGKELFELTIDRAKKIGIEKIYISANDSEATQKFYLRLGCIDAVEVNQGMVDAEPYDRQMEYIIKW
jgi:ribosomal protein S18 acetylase RimI-like enzyme